MADYAKAAADLKARLDAKTKRKNDLTDFFEALRAAVQQEVAKANPELTSRAAPPILIRPEGHEEPVIYFACRHAFCKLDLHRDDATVSAAVTGESGTVNILYAIQLQESPISAQCLTPSVAPQENSTPAEMAAVFVEALIVGAP